MQRSSLLGFALIVASSGALLGFSPYQGTVLDRQQLPQEAVLDRKQLKAVLEQLGYEVKDLDTTAGKEKYSVNFTEADLNIPVAYEISPNNAYVWLTVYLGSAPPETDSRSFALLKQNAKIQPSQFYITESGKLMMAVAIENRAVTNGMLRQKSEGIIKNVANTKTVWQG